jgi:hypothetical protein
MEIWKEFYRREYKSRDGENRVVSYHSYQISNYGNSRKVTQDGKVLPLKQSLSGGKGTQITKYYCFSSNHHKYVHRVVAEAFIPNPDNLPTVNHKDLNKQNNHVDNLEWVSYTDNLKHYREAGNPMSQETKDRISKDRTGKKRYSMNGINWRYFTPGTEPEGYFHKSVWKKLSNDK